MNVEGMTSLSESSPMRIQSTNSNERAYRLYNQCALKEILIQDSNNVRATATKKDVRGKKCLHLSRNLVPNGIKLKYICIEISELIQSMSNPPFGHLYRKH